MLEASEPIVLESPLEERQMLRRVHEPSEHLVSDSQGPLSGQLT